MEPRTFEVAGRLELRMRIRSGDIRITQSEAATASVHVTGERKDEEISIEAETSAIGTRLHVVQSKVGGGWGFRGGGLQIDVEVPEGSAAEITTGSGDLIVEGTLGELAFQTGSGDARIGAVTGSVGLKSASGDIRVGSIGGDVSLATASGDVAIGSIEGALNARTASGDLEVGAVAGEARAVSASGDLTIGSASADLALRSVSGDIEVGVPAGMRIWVDLSSTSGDTVSELQPGEDLDGAEGSFEIRATTVSGDVRIRRASTRDASPV